LAGSWRVVVRERGSVSRARFDSVEAALDEVSSRGRSLQKTVRARPVDTKVMGRFEPAQQVAARLELSGPGGVRCGVDVRGDGSAEAFVGRFRRRTVGQRGSSKSAFDELRREVLGGGR
jgi:hypothetical protein